MPVTWTCSICHKTFSRRGDLSRHSNLHTGYKPFECSECGKTFSQKTGLKTHWNTHTGDKPYICREDPSKCHATFGDPSSFARHVRELHHTSGGYRCPAPECNSSIKRKSAFNAHLKKKHNIDPSSIDLDPIAPKVSPSTTGRKRRRKGQDVPTIQIDSQESVDLICPTLEPAESSYSPGLTTQDLHVSSQYGIGAFQEPWLPNDRPVIGLPDVLNAGLYEMDSPSSTPPLSHSQSPSPAPSYIHGNEGLSFAQLNFAASPIETGCYESFTPVPCTSTPYDDGLFTMPVYDTLSATQGDISWDDLFL